MSSEEGFVHIQPEAIHCTADSTIVNLRGFSNIEDRSVVNGVIERSFGPDAEVIYDGGKAASSAGKLAVGFSKWNSSWDPKAKPPEIDPTLN